MPAFMTARVVALFLIAVFGGETHVFAGIHLTTSDIAKKLGEPWSKKDGTALELKESGHNYRVYKPMATTTASGGLRVSLKMDHMRGGAKDDHAILELVFNAKRELDDVDVSMIIQKDGRKLDQIKTILQAVENLHAVAQDRSKAFDSKITRPIVDAVRGIVTNEVEEEHGGIEYFPVMVHHVVDVISTSVDVD